MSAKELRPHRDQRATRDETTEKSNARIHAECQQQKCKCEKNLFAFFLL